MKVKIESDVDIDGNMSLEDAEEFIQYVLGIKDTCRVEKDFLCGEYEYKFTNLKCKENNP